MKPYYEDEQVTIFHGDCREILPLVEADVLVTDPPYGVKWPPRALHSRKSLRETSVPAITGDESTQVRDDVLAAWLPRPAIVFGVWRQPRPDKITHRLIWHKAGRQPGIASAAWYPTDEEIYVIGGGWIGGPSGTVITTTEQRSRQPKLIGHPTPKPLDLMAALISKCPPEWVVLDPFMGSGSTLRAAKDLGRKAIGIELEERYCEIAAQRCAQDVLDLGVAA